MRCRLLLTKIFGRQWTVQKRRQRGVQQPKTGWLAGEVCWQRTKCPEVRDNNIIILLALCMQWEIPFDTPTHGTRKVFTVIRVDLCDDMVCDCYIIL